LVSFPRISVVVPFFNNGDVLEDALASIAGQTFTDLQVVMVDDGSTDDGPSVARAWQAADRRFTLVSATHGGPGRARNTGIGLARGEYLAFVDGDDVLPPHAYELLLHTLESSGSDFVSGAVQRISTAGLSVSALHARAVTGRRIGTHISKTPSLLYDISVWNKLFRRSFWDAHRLRYPEGMVWEDLQLMTRAHVLARAVDVIPEFVYYWRERGAGELSITQNRTDITNLADRVSALLAIDAFLRERASRRLLRQHQVKALVNDLWLYVRDLHRVSEEYLSGYFTLAGKYLRQVEPRVWRMIPADRKLAYYLTVKGLRRPLLEFVDWRLDQRGTAIPVIRRAGRLRADLPLREDRSLAIPGWVYRPHWHDLDPFVQVDGVTWQRGNLVITGIAYVPSIDVSRRRHTSKIIVLRPRHRFRPPVVSVAGSRPSPRATALSCQERYDYTWAGFRCEISSRWFRLAGRWLTGTWDAFILVRGHGVWRPARLDSPALGDAERPASLVPEPGLRVLPSWAGRHLHIGVVHTPGRLAGCHFAGDAIVLEVGLDRPPRAPVPGSAQIILARHGGICAQAFPASVHVAGAGAVARASVPVEALAGQRAGGAGGSRIAATAGGLPGSAAWPEAAAGLAWDLYVSAAGRGRLRVAFPDDLDEARHRRGDREIAVERSRDGYAVLTERPPRLIISSHAWTGEGSLLLAGSYAGVAGEVDLILRRRASSEEFTVRCERSGETFTVRIDAAAMPTFGRILPLHDGHWELHARAGDGTPVSVGYEHARLGEISHRKVAAGPKLYAFTTAGYDTPVLSVEPRLRLAEQGNFNRRVLRKAVYPVQARRPLTDAVLFESWKGQQCADNPRGIAEELRRRGDDRDHVWVVNDYCAAVPHGDRMVLSGTEEYFEALARSKYVVSNDDMPAYFRKRAGQVYLQTWHGTPLKRIGFDVEHPQFVSGTAYFGHLADDVAKWDVLLSQNPFSTPILRRAFRFEGEIAETGYPRNDVLARDRGLAGEIRRNLRVPAGKRVVMYAPTWRDNQYYASGRYRFDLRLNLGRARQALGADHVLLLRGHHQMAADVPAGTGDGFTIDVTSYPDIAELFLITDVLITDYSSVMFDFAATGRPMLFFAYDLALYRDTLRGFYVDFEAEAPGPLLSTSEEVLAAVRDVDGATAGYAQAYAAFAAKYCPLDDGKAAARVCDRLFAS
jgi:CDP-glycerol glycerophosphotransferase